MAIIFMLFAGIFVSISNLCMRKSIDQGGTTKGFLILQMAMSFCVAVLLNPVRNHSFAINTPVVVLGILAGLILAALLWTLGKALQSGPPGLTFSILNGSTVMPAIVMALLFGASYGFPYTTWHAIGSLLVLAGLVWAGKGLDGLQRRSFWLICSGAMFASHILLLVLFQYRALLLNVVPIEELTSLFSKTDIQSQWFSPMMFASAFLVQMAVFLWTDRRKLGLLETTYGLTGGLANGLCTYFMIWSTEVANPLENAVIFPIFSVVTIALSNLWGQRLYQERVNWKACQLSAFGLIIGTVNWHQVASAMGF